MKMMINDVFRSAADSPNAPNQLYEHLSWSSAASKTSRSRWPHSNLRSFIFQKLRQGAGPPPQPISSSAPSPAPFLKHFPFTIGLRAAPGHHGQPLQGHRVRGELRKGRQGQRQAKAAMDLVVAPPQRPGGQGRGQREALASGLRGIAANQQLQGQELQVLRRR